MSSSSNSSLFPPKQGDSTSPTTSRETGLSGTTPSSPFGSKTGESTFSSRFATPTLKPAGATSSPQTATSGALGNPFSKPALSALSTPTSPLGKTGTSPAPTSAFGSKPAMPSSFGKTPGTANAPTSPFPNRRQARSVQLPPPSARLPAPLQASAAPPRGVRPSGNPPVRRPLSARKNLRQALRLPCRRAWDSSLRFARQHC